MESYNVVTKATDVMLEILNLDKKEVISIDGISNQEFSQVRIFLKIVFLHAFSSVSWFSDLTRSQL